MASGYHTGQRSSKWQKPMFINNYKSSEHSDGASHVPGRAHDSRHRLETRHGDDPPLQLRRPRWAQGHTVREWWSPTKPRPSAASPRYTQCREQPWDQNRKSRKSHGTDVLPQPTQLLDEWLFIHEVRKVSMPSLFNKDAILITFLINEHHIYTVFVFKIFKRNVF